MCSLRPGSREGRGGHPFNEVVGLLPVENVGVSRLLRCRRRGRGTHGRTPHSVADLTLLSSTRTEDPDTDTGPEPGLRQSLIYVDLPRGVETFRVVDGLDERGSGW